MSLRVKFWIGFALIAGLAVSLAGYGAGALSRTGDLIVRLYDEPLVGVNYARAASATLSDARRLMDQSLPVGSGQSAAAIGSLRRMKSEIAEDLRIVRQRMNDAAVIGALDSAETSVAVWFDNCAMVLVATPGGVVALPMPALIEQQAKSANARLDDLVEQVAANGYAYRARAQGEIRTSSVVLASLCGGIILSSALFVLLLAYTLIRPIRAATRIAEAVAAGNNVDVAVTTRRDEIGRLLNCLAAMQVNLRDRAALATVLLREKEQAAEILGQINLRFDAALNNMSHGLLMCDRESRIVVINRQFCEIAGVDRAGILPNASYRDVLALSVAAGNHPGRTFDEVWAKQSGIFQSRRPTTAVMTNPSGRTIEISVAPLADGGWIAMQADITERRRSEEQIVFLARHDPLTRMPNRVLFHERLDQALAQAERGVGFALLWLDLDGFKAVNDVLGHPVGDSLLRAVADRLRDILRETDTVARFGGDEFAVLQTSVSTPSDVTALARRIVQSISQPYELDGHQVVIGTSIGIALAPGGCGAHPVKLLKDADLALYRAKQSGRGTWRFFELAMDTVARMRRELELDLGGALSAGQFELHYQPLMDSQSRTVSGFEALLRWRHPVRGLVPPGDFITVAEEMGIIVPPAPGCCIRPARRRRPGRTTCAWRSICHRCRCATKRFRVWIADALTQAGLSAGRLELEITELVPLGNDSATLSVLHALHGLGTRVALDDFGTGYSSLSYLRGFPFDTIKIDHSFVSELASRDDCVAIVRAITALGATLQMKTTAEGVETEAQFEFLAAAGCTEVQGYLFSRPVRADALPALIERCRGRRRPRLFRCLSRAASGGRPGPATATSSRKRQCRRPRQRLDQRRKRVRTHRAAEQVTLHLGAPRRCQKFELRFGSTPSAVVFICSVAPSAVIARTIATQSSRLASSLTNERSILIVSNGNPRRYDSD